MASEVRHRGCQPLIPRGREGGDIAPSMAVTRTNQTRAWKIGKRRLHDYHPPYLLGPTKNTMLTGLKYDIAFILSPLGKELHAGRHLAEDAGPGIDKSNLGNAGLQRAHAPPATQFTKYLPTKIPYPLSSVGSGSTSSIA